MIDQKITAVATFAQASNLPLQIVITALILLVSTLFVGKVIREIGGMSTNNQEWFGLILFIELTAIVVGLLWMVWQ